MKNKAEMGVGTLIIFIALLLVAAVAAGVLIQTSGSLQQKSLATGQEARKQIATNIKVIELSGVDGRNHYLNNLTMLIKLSPGSEPIPLNTTLITVNTKSNTAQLKYLAISETHLDYFNTLRGEELGEVNHTWTRLHQDLDYDGSSDYIRVGDDNKSIVVNLSTAGVYTLTGMTDISSASSIPVTLNNKWYVDNTEKYAQITLSGTTNKNGTIVAGVTFYVDTVKYKYKGEYTIQYLQKSADWTQGYLQQGDVIKIYLESPNNLNEEDYLRIKVIPKTGMSSIVEFTLPDVLNTEREYLYP